MDQQETFWQWRVLELDKRGKDKWRTLRWRMNEADALAWAAKEGQQLEKVPGSGEERASGHYVGWGRRSATKAFRSNHAAAGPDARRAGQLPWCYVALACGLLCQLCSHSVPNA